MKKLKKLTLQKKQIVILSDSNMNQIKGGGTSYLLFPCVDTYANYTLWDNTCTCPPEKPGTYFQEPDTGINDCPNHSKAGSGCDAETCGWAYTCNG